MIAFHYLPADGQVKRRGKARSTDILGKEGVLVVARMRTLDGLDSSNVVDISSISDIDTVKTCSLFKLSVTQDPLALVYDADAVDPNPTVYRGEITQDLGNAIRAVFADKSISATIRLNLRDAFTAAKEI